MLDIIKFWAKAAVADRKGATALEYALIASAVAAVILGAFRLFFGNLSTFLAGITYS
jgi:Flp pilus assembly pilin Flp